MNGAGRRARGRSAAAFSGPMLAGLAALAPSAVVADDIVYMEGITTISSSGIGRQAVSNRDREALCSTEGRLAVRQALSRTHTRIAEHLGSVDAGLGREYEAAVDFDGVDGSDTLILEALDEACSAPVQRTQVFRIVYGTCRMTMREGSMTLDVRFPPGQGQGFISIVDHDSREAIVSPVEFTEIMNQDTGAVQGRNFGTVGSPTDRRTFTMPVHRNSSVNLDAGQRTFDFTFQLDFMQSLLGAAGGAALAGDAASGDEAAQALQAMQALGMTPTIKTTGSAWLAPDAPGAGIVRAFYETFGAAMQSGQGSLLGGLYNHQLLEHGLPIDIDQTTEVTMQGGFMGGGAGESETSRTRITRIVGPLSTPNAYCEQSIVPAGYSTSNPMSALAPGAPGQANAGAGNSGSDGNAGAGAPPGLADAMSELNEAMSNLSEEDRAAMEQFGAGFGQLLGGALSGPAPPAAAGAAAPTAAAVDGRPSSADLYSDDLTQMVQNHLQALGYDPGNTDGELSTATVIAISQFQAEKGLEVTGEVSPQLAGRLAAEVDSR